MMAFFKPWRQRFGLLTLVAALLTMGLWMRSRDRFDQIIVPFGKTAINVSSACSGIDFCLSTNLSEPWTLSWRSFELSPSEVITPWDEGHEIEWRWDRAGFHFGAGRLPSRRDIDFVVPYWSVVIPLTLISAYLLLMKPR